MPKGKTTGKGKGKAAPKKVQPSVSSIELIIMETGLGSSSRSYGGEILKVINNLLSRKHLASLPASVKQEYIARKCEKELESVLLPDAPPRKRQSRKPSPLRVPCRLVPGTPITPPLPKLQPWQLRKLEGLEEGAAEMSEVSKVTETMEISELVKVTDTPWCPTGVATPIHIEFMDQMGSDKVPITMPTVKLEPTLAVQKIESVRQPAVNSLSSSSSRTSFVSESDLLKGKSEDLETWQNDIDDDDDDDIAEAESGYFEAELRYVEEECIPELLPPDAAVWLNNEDQVADQTIIGMLPDNLEFNWSSNRANFLGTREEFTGTPGPTFPVNENTCPAEIFKKFFDTDLLNLLVFQTNKHATKLIDQNKKKHSRLLRFKNTDMDEMATFLAILILQGCAPLSVESEFWKENGHLTLKYFKDIMQLNRFLLLKRLLHFNESQDDTQATNDTRTDVGKLRKIAPVLDHLNRKFSELYLPGQNVAIDESLLKWHGRLSFAQKIATKAAKIRVKSYELCESSTGYLWRFFVYTGNENSQSQRDLDPTRPPTSSNMTAKIVCELVQPLLHKGHTVVMDNFYNSPLLARYLKANGTDCYGTIRTNRKFEPESIKSVSKTKMRVGELLQSFCRDVYVMMWRDTNIVSMISTYHNGDVGGREKYGKYEFKPQIVLDYNSTMGGIDLKDSCLSHFKIERTRNRAWYKKVFRRLLNVTVFNSYIIARTQNKHITHRAFRIRLAEELIKVSKPPTIERPVTEVRLVSTVSGPGGRRRPILQGNHYIDEGLSKNTRCVLCKKCRTRYLCKQCGVSLCLRICFERYHSCVTLSLDEK